LGKKRFYSFGASPNRKAEENEMSAKQKTTKAKHAKTKLHDIKPKRNPVAGKKSGGKHHNQPVEYLKFELKDAIVTSVSP
jgi:hypothetical protein